MGTKLSTRVTIEKEAHKFPETSENAENSAHETIELMVQTSDFMFADIRPQDAWKPSNTIGTFPWLFDNLHLNDI